MMTRLTLSLCVLTAVLCVVPLAHAQDRPAFVPVTDAMLQNPAPGDWLMWRRTLDSWGYSPLDQIDADNVGQLRLVWTHALGTGVQEPTPLVYGGIMYVPNSADHIQAFDAANGDQIWEYRRDYPEGAMGGTNRNLAIWGNTILNGSGDNMVYALDALSGELVWETPVVDPTLRARPSSGPIVANGKVITGRQCQPDAGHDSCVITAHDAQTGEELWRTRTIPRPGDPGDETWSDVPLDQRWHVGTWMVPSYDPELNMVFIGTSVTIPAPKFILGGNDQQHLFHNSTLAIDADNGEIVWYYQHVVDHWDLDHPFERLLVETAVAPDPDEVEWINPTLEHGEVRKVITGVPGKTGIVYTLDRQTGAFLWGRSTVIQNVVANIDGVSGEVQVNPEALFTAIDQERFICPAAAGGRNWPAGAYNPQTNAMYIPMQNTCMRARTRTDQRDPSLVYGLNMPAELAPGAEGMGVIWAISAETGEMLWKHEQRAGAMSMVSTGGGLLFGGDTNGRFRAFDQDTGEVLWETNLGAPVSGYPISFALNGQQFIAVATGSSLLANTASRLTPELKPGTGSNMFVFALPMENGR